MAGLIVQRELKNYAPNGYGKSWVAQINGMFDHSRTSYEYLRNGFGKTSNYFLREGHVYKVHEPIDQSHAKENWVLVHEGELLEVDEPYVLRYARKLQKAKVLGEWGPEVMEADND